MITLTGIAVPFYDGSRRTEFQMSEGLVERFTPSAFAGLGEQKRDVLLLTNHDEQSIALARLKAGTLRLSSTKKGLRFFVKGDETSQRWLDVAAAVKRQDFAGVSVGFLIKDEEYQQEGRSIVRTIRDAELVEISLVNSPAYEATTVQLVDTSEQSRSRPLRHMIRQRVKRDPLAWHKRRFRLLYGEAFA